MYYVVFATDRTGREAARAAIRPRHRAFLRDPRPHPVRVVLGGPTLASEGGAMNGTLLVVQAERIEDVQAFVHDDPYMHADLFESLVVRPWAWGLGAPAESP